MTITLSTPELATVIFLFILAVVVAAVLIFAKRTDRPQADKAIENYDSEGA